MASLDPFLAPLWFSEWIVCGFFSYLAILSLLLALDPGRRRRILLTSLVCISLAVMLSQLRPSPLLRLVREWVPAIFLLQGYWTCGLFFRRPMPRIERALLSLDRSVLRRTGGAALIERGPRMILECFELAYLTVYPFIPIAFGCFWWLGYRDSADRFWLAVLTAGFGAYGALPWIQTRPPRVLEPGQTIERRGLVVRRLNLTVLNRASVQVNTFPSGHASTTLAAALAVASADPSWGALWLGLAASVTIATVVGRYHYALDSLLGLALGGFGWWIAFRVPGVS